MKTAFLLFVLLILTSCKKEEKVVLKEDFVFSYESGSSFNSLRFTNDTVFMAKNYPNHYYVFYYPLQSEDIKRINVFLDNVKVSNLKEEYRQDGIVDAGTYQFQFLNRNQLIYVYGYYGEDEIIELKELNRFSSFLGELEMSKMIKFNDSTHYGMEKVYWNKDIDFGNVKRFILPDIPYDSLK